MAPNDTTLLEPPATPAPLFAYRALRGFIFGSPDPNESPERDAQIEQKENILPTRLGGTGKELFKDSHATRLSPSKRKRGSDVLAPPISPTKGILRTPGLLTPRAKALRDVNVKFRSVSPELRRKDVKHHSGVSAAPAPQPAPATTATATVVKSRDEPRKKTNTKTADDEGANTTCKAALQKPSSTTSTTTANSAFDDYQRRTERQMKILIAERNKWRDMARSSGDENTRLKLQLAQVERENERLQRKLHALEKSQHRQQQPSVSLSDHVDEQGEDSRATKKAKSKSKHDKEQIATTAVGAAAATATVAPSLSTLPLRPLSPLASLAQRLEPEPGPEPEPAPESHAAARTGLAPDRYSAARARLQARQQARKASSSLRTTSGERSGKSRQVIDEADESHIDWAGLAL